MKYHRDPITKYRKLFGIPYTWESQAEQFTRRDPMKVGITLERNYLGELGDLTEIECLLFRSKYGTLQGILYYYSKVSSENDLEKVGNVNIFVDPKHQREGIGTALLRYAMTLWDIDFEQQRYSDEGLLLMLNVRGLVGADRVRKPDPTPKQPKRNPKRRKEIRTSEGLELQGPFPKTRVGRSKGESA